MRQSKHCHFSSFNLKKIKGTFPFVKPHQVWPDQLSWRIRVAHFQPKWHNPTVVKTKTTAGQETLCGSGIAGSIFARVATTWECAKLKMAPGITPLTRFCSADTVVQCWWVQPSSPWVHSPVSPTSMLESSQKSTKAKESPAVGQSTDTISWFFTSSVNTLEPTSPHS